MALRNWFNRHRLDEDDFDEEVRSHMAMATRDRLGEGVDPATARLAAHREFGNIALTTDAARRVWSPRWWEAIRDLLSDIRHAGRVLVRNPGFSIVVVAVLALGIGLNAAVFTLFKGLALEPLAGVSGSGRLGVVISRTTGGRQDGLSYPDFKYLRDHDHAFTGVSGSAMSMLNVGLKHRADRVMGEFVTGNYFQLLGVSAVLGRTFVPADEDAPGTPPIVILGHGLWQRAFGGDPHIVGSTIHVNAHPLTVVGVLSPSFHGTVVSFDIEMFLPITMAPELGLNFQAFQAGDPNLLSDPAARFLMVLGQPRPGVPLTAAAAQTSVLSAQLVAERPLDEVRERLAVIPIWQSPYGAQTYMLPAIVIVGAMGALLLLLVCANIAGLVLARGISRRGEVALRLALGASRRRILRLLLVESLVLAIPGGAAGLLLVYYALPTMWSGAAESAPGRLFLDLSVDGLVVAFALAAAFASAVFFGFVPAFRSSRVDLMTVMKDDSSPRSATTSRLRSALVGAQVAISVMLLVGAGLVLRSLDAARRADPGFDATNVTSVTVDLAPSGYDAAHGRTFYRQLLDRLRTDDSIESATLATIYPMTMVEFPGQKVAVEGYQPPSDEDLTFGSNVVTPDYFRTLRIPLMSGRDFTDDDTLDAPQVAIVNLSLATRFWGGAAQALNRRLRVGRGEWRTIVGVARDIKYTQINEGSSPFVYLPFLQAYQSSVTIHTRTARPVPLPAQLDQVRGHLAAIDAELPVVDARSLTDQTSAALGVFAMIASMLLVFGAAALGLAAMGIYGLVSYTVRQSTHEIGIRMALGARPADVIRRFLGRGLRLGLIGAVAGLAASFAATRLLGALLYGVGATDAISFASASLVVLASTALATVVPAWRASRTSPVVALRHQ